MPPTTDATTDAAPRLADRAHRANVAACLHAIPAEAAVDDGQPRPAIEVAGVLVFAYVDDTATVRISAHWDTADINTFPEWTDEVPVRVSGVDPEHIDPRLHDR